MTGKYPVVYYSESVDIQTDNIQIQTLIWLGIFINKGVNNEQETYFYQLCYGR